MKKRLYKNLFLKIAIVVFIFWISDFVFHSIGVGESRYYYFSKFANAILFSVLWFFIINSSVYWKKILFSFAFGTWISFYYLISSYSGFVQLFGIYARYSPPPFVLGGLTLNPVLWWFFHALVFYIGLEVADLIKK